jgi:hypothetical protein
VVFDTDAEIQKFISSVLSFSDYNAKKSLDNLVSANFDAIPPRLRSYEEMLESFNKLLSRLGFGNCLLAEGGRKELLCEQFGNFMRPDFSRMRETAGLLDIEPTTRGLFKVMRNSKDNSDPMRYIDEVEGFIDVAVKFNGETVIDMATKNEWFELAAKLRDLPKPGNSVDDAIHAFGGRVMTAEEGKSFFRNE